MEGIIVKEWEAAYLAGIIDGEGSITLTKNHKNEFRRPCISIASTDLELLDFLKTITGGTIANKKNYNPRKHKNSFTLTIRKKETVMDLLASISGFLRVDKKKKRANLILENYDKVTPRNGKYCPVLLNEKQLFEEEFFKI